MFVKENPDRKERLSDDGFQHLYATVYLPKPLPTIPMVTIIVTMVDTNAYSFNKCNF